MTRPYSASTDNSASLSVVPIDNELSKPEPLPTRLVRALAGISIVVTTVFLLAALASGSNAQKDRFAALSAKVGVVFAISFIVSLSDQEDED